jgi:hypothetical protein
MFHNTHTDDVVLVWPDGHDNLAFMKQIELAP